MARSSSPGLSALRCGATTKSTTATCRSPPLRRPDRAHAIERGGQRDHRSRRQRHAEIAADRRHVPDFERGQKRPAALIEQRRRGPVRRERHAVEFGDLAGRGDAQALLGHLQRAASRDRRYRSAAKLAAAARKTTTCRRRARRRPRSSRQLRALARSCDLGDGVKVHSSAVHNSCRLLQVGPDARRRPGLPPQ